jgi:hypothetical protein
MKQTTSEQNLLKYVKVHGCVAKVLVFFFLVVLQS